MCVCIILCFCFLQKNDDDEAGDEDEEDEDDASSSSETPIEVDNLQQDEPIQFRLHLVPQQSMNATEVHATIDLEVFFPDIYPQW